MAALAEPTTTTSAAEAKASTGRKGGGSRRRRGAKAAGPLAARFFLIKGSSKGGLELAQEVASENEAMVESFRVGGSFAVVTEWKPSIDLTSGAPVIRKEAVKHETSNALIASNTASLT